MLQLYSGQKIIKRLSRNLSELTKWIVRKSFLWWGGEGGGQVFSSASVFVFDV